MFLAIAEIRRSVGRFALLGGAIGLLVLLLLFFQAVAGALTSGLTGAFESATAQVWVYDDASRLNPQASVLDETVADEVADVEDVVTAAPVTFTVFEVDGEPTAVVATDPGSPALPGAASSGRMIEADGEGIAAGGFGTDGPSGTIDLSGVPVEVVGQADGATFNILPTVFTSRATATEATAARAGAPLPLPANVVAVTVAEDADPTSVATAITDVVDGVSAVDRAEAIANLPGAGDITRSFGILYILLYLVVAIVTAVFFQILTVQKRDSLVLLRAVGARPRDLVVPVLAQVVVVVGLAVAIGAGTAAGLLTAARDVFGSQLDPSTVATSSVAILGLGVAAGLWSVQRILRIEPVEAVRGGGEL